MKTKELTQATILAAVYVALGVLIPFIGFGAIQCRVSDALAPLITIFGMPGVIGLTIGELIYNFYGYTTGFALGWLDLLSPIILIVPKIAICKLGYKGLIIHIVTVTLWVSYLLTAFGVPFMASLITVGLGCFIPQVLLGIPLTELVKKRLQ